jgi:hypothetical protein
MRKKKGEPSGNEIGVRAKGIAGGIAYILCLSPLSSHEAVIPEIGEGHSLGPNTAIIQKALDSAYEEEVF